MEESVEHFILQWQSYAARVQCFPRAEGSPLLEVRVQGHIVYLFERTNPYLLTPGPALLILNPVTEQLTPSETDASGLEIVGLSRLRAWGRVLIRQPHTVVIDAGTPLVVSVLAGVPTSVVPGGMVSFTSLAPIHGFALSLEKPTPAPTAKEKDAL